MSFTGRVNIVISQLGELLSVDTMVGLHAASTAESSTQGISNCCIKSARGIQRAWDNALFRLLACQKIIKIGRCFTEWFF